MTRGTWLLLVLLAGTGSGCADQHFLPNPGHPGTIREQHAVFGRFNPYPELSTGASIGSEPSDIRPRSMDNAPVAEQAYLRKNEYAPLPAPPPQPLPLPPG